MLVVTAVHTFVAEHGDELEFSAGEQIEVLERDDEFGDGWWRGRNQKGEEGLFPATYITESPDEDPVGNGHAKAATSPAAVPAAALVEPTSPSTPPSPRANRPSLDAPHESPNGIAPDQVGPSSGIVATAAAGLGAAAVGVTTVMGKTIGEIEHAIENIVQPANETQRAPVDSEDEEELGIGSNARARLAAQAQLANEQRDKNRASGGVAGLVYSDESDDEEEERRRSMRTGAGNAGANGKPNNILPALQPALTLPGTPPLDTPAVTDTRRSTPSIGSFNVPTGQASAWGVDEVVQWAKSKGFEEWPRFQEHEITGDLLLELDANLLKELDIPQFGKRLRIAQAISELRRPSSVSSPPMSPGSASLARGMSAPPHAFSVPINSSPPPSITPPLSGDASSTHSRKVSTTSTSLAPPMQPIKEAVASTTSSSVPPSPVTPGSATTKRESFGSLGHRKGKLSIENKERLSFFGRNRKPAPSTPSDTRITPRTTAPQVHQMQAAAPQEPVINSSAAAMKQIGKPDHSGYMKKKGERYGWKSRFFVLKGAHLYYMASETEDRVKGHIPLQGHRVIVDENTNPGSYGFRLVGPNKTHSFSSAEQAAIRGWMKALMKATIARDYSVAVTSSCNIPTVSLAEAQALSPRPPSPATREATQRATRRENTNTLTPHDASILMSLDNPTRMSITPSRPSKDNRRPSAVQQNDPQLVAWVNSVLPSQYPRAQSIPQSFVSGEVIFLLVRSMTGIDPSPPVPPSAFNPESDGLPGIEGLFAMMDILVDAGIDTLGVTLNEIRSGDSAAICRLLESVRAVQP